MTEKDFVFYMGGDVFFNNEKIATLKIDGPPLAYVVNIKNNIFSFKNRKEAIDKIIESVIV
jgi:hypothetical protein